MPPPLNSPMLMTIATKKQYPYSFAFVNTFRIIERSHLDQDFQVAGFFLSVKAT